MRKIFFIVLLMVFPGIPLFTLGSLTGFADENPRLRVGERLEYKVNVKGIPVGEQVMTVIGETEYEGHPVYHIVMELRNYAALSLFFKFYEKDVLLLDKKSLFPRYIKREIHERKKFKTEEIKFLIEEKRIEQIETEDKKVKKNVFAMIEPCLENLSLVYYLRNRPWRTGKDSFYFLTSRGPEAFSFKWGGKGEEVSSPYKRMNADKIANPDSRITVWISQDESAVPVAIQVTKDFGNIDARLAEMK